jgi:hypothetical protein
MSILPSVWHPIMKGYDSMAYIMSIVYRFILMKLRPNLLPTLLENYG